MATYYLPGIGGQVESTDGQPLQSSPLLNTYSPRLFGSPPQMTNLCDMRLMSSDGDNPGPVGDFYLTKILQDAQIANFCIGRALFTGGMSSLANIIRVAGQYAYAMTHFDVFDSNGDSVRSNTAVQMVMAEANLDTYNKAMDSDEGWTNTTTASSAGLSDLDSDATVADLSSLGNSSSIIQALSNILGAGGQLVAPILTSLSVQQPFYTFESDWYSYINNVKMMINTAVIMLGLQKASVKIGEKLLPIGMDVNVTEDTDVWSQYRFITPAQDYGSIKNGIDKQTGDTAQYVSFMIEPQSTTETFTNNVGDSQIYSSVINTGSSIGSEIAFITNSSASAVDDTLVNIAGSAISAAEKVMTAMTAGTGRFTAAIAGSMARSYVGDHTIYPQIFQSHTATSTMTLKVHLSASGGDAYSYLTEILVPYFFILGMALPQLSKNNASAYSYPPIIQCNIPGVWGTRLGMVTSVSVTKNTSGKDYSIFGYPLSIDVQMTITDLQHTLVTTPMSNPSLFLNNHTMFDYIAQCAGVDKYRVNGSIRLVSRLALASSAVRNVFHNVGEAVKADVSTRINRLTGTYRL